VAPGQADQNVSTVQATARSEPVAVITAAPTPPSREPMAPADARTLFEQETKPVQTGPHARTEEFLGFRLDGEEYGVSIRAVKEIIRPAEITPIPRSPADVLGLISLRGTIVPILDVRQRLGLPVREMGPKSRIVVVVVESGPVGMVVDHVTEVISANPDALEPPPATLGEREAALVTATLRHRDRLVGLLHLERLVAIEPATPLRAVA
jgi:purine-binding chemotaxis protein CheW